MGDKHMRNEFNKNFAIRNIYICFLLMVGINNISIFAETKKVEKQAKQIKAIRSSPNSDMKIVEKDLSTDNEFIKLISLSGEQTDSAVKIVSDIPESLVLQGTEFFVFRVGDSTPTDLKHNSQYKVKFHDTNNNGLVDRIEWEVVTTSVNLLKKERAYIIKSKKNNHALIDVSDNLQQMELVFDHGLYGKILNLLNAQASGLSKKADFIKNSSDESFSTAVDSMSDTHRVIIMVGLTANQLAKSQTSMEPVLIKDALHTNKAKLARILNKDFNVKNPFVAKHLSTLVVDVPIEELGRLAQEPVIASIGDGELESQFELTVSRELIGANHVRNNLGFDGTGVLVSVIDSGIGNQFDGNGHQDLPNGAKIFSRFNCRDGECFSGTGEDYQDTTLGGHGTSVAGIIGGLGIGNPSLKGVAPGCQLINMKFDGTDNFILALDQSFAIGADVINVSKGFGLCSQGNHRTLNLCVDQVVDLGIMVVKSAGNEGFDNRDDVVVYETISAPGSAFNLITVGSWNDMNDSTGNTGDIDRDSGRGPSCPPSPGDTTYTGGRLKPEIIAPGTGILAPSIDGGYAEFNGTSAATPHVTGSIALLMDAESTLTPLQIKVALLAGAQWDPKGLIGLPMTASIFEGLGGSNTTYRNMNTYGLGLLDTAESLEIVQNTLLSSSVSTAIDRDFILTTMPGKVVKVVVSWFLSTIGPVNASPPTPRVLSNLDVVVTSSDGQETYNSTSSNQNNEFVVFTAIDTQYTASVRGVTIDIGTHQPFAIATNAESLAPTSDLNPVCRILDSSQSVDELTRVMLDGSASSDNETPPGSLQYSWRLLSGNPDFEIRMHDADQAIANFLAPNLQEFESELFSFELAVTDSVGQTNVCTTNITVNGIVDSVISAVDDQFTVAVDSQETLLDILDNDSPGSGVNIVVEADAVQGVARVIGNKIGYTPATGFQGIDDLSYTIDDNTDFSSPARVNVKVGEEYAIYAAIADTNEILRWESNGTFISPVFIDNSMGFSFSNPTAMLFKDPFLFVTTENGRIYRFDAQTGAPAGSGGNAEFVQNQGATVGDVVLANNRLYFTLTTSNEIRYVNADSGGNFSVLFADDGDDLDLPVGLALKSDKLYVANSGDNSILEFDINTGSDSFFVPSNRGGLSDPRDLGFGSDGNLYVLGSVPETVYRFDENGDSFGFGGSTQNATFTSSNLFKDPTSIDATPDGFLYVGNSGDENIVEIEIPETLTSPLVSNFVPSGSEGLTDPISVEIGPVPLPPAPPQPPVLDSIPDQSMNEGESLTVLVQATDSDSLNTDIDLDFFGLPSFGIGVDNGDGTGSIQFDPGFLDAGEFNITVRATDNDNLFDDESFTLTVTNVNRSPTVIITQPTDGSQFEDTDDISFVATAS